MDSFSFSLHALHPATSHLLKNTMKVFSVFLLLISFPVFTSPHALAAGILLHDNEYLPNGSFEHGPKPKDLNGSIIKGRYSLPKWEINGHVEYCHGGPQITSMGYVVTLFVIHGLHAVKLGKDASISQIVPVKPGSFYAITVRATWSCPQDREILRVSVPPQSGDLPLQDTRTLSSGDTYAWGFKATSKFAKLTLQNPAGIEEDLSCGPFVDAVAIKKLTPPRLTRVNVVKNGGFEEGPLVLNNSSEGVLLASQYLTSTLPGWIVQSPKAVKFIDSKHFSVPSGLFAVELVGGRESAISQIIRTIPEKNYTLTFTVGDAKNNCHGSLVLEVVAANATLEVPFTANGMGAFKIVSMSFRADSQRTRITFYSSFYKLKQGEDAAYCGPVVDQVVVLSVRRK